MKWDIKSYKRLAPILAVAGLAALSSACSSDASNSNPSTDIEQDADVVAAASLASSNTAPVAQQNGTECAGFTDGSSQTNALSGVVLGDSREKVMKQLRCGEIVYTLEDMSYIVGGGGDRDIAGHAGNEHVEARFIGMPGNEKLVQFTRVGEYKDGSGPSVESVTQSITQRYPLAKILELRGGRREVTRIGFGESLDGTPFMATSR